MADTSIRATVDYGKPGKQHGYLYIPYSHNLGGWANLMVPISVIGLSTQFLNAHASVPAATMQELVALAKKDPGKLSFGSSGVGSIAHLGTELLKHMAGGIEGRWQHQR